jgi:excisionase family DNA binding protein
MAAKTPPAPSRLIPAKDAAEHLGIPYSSLRDLHFNGQIDVVKFGRAWFFKRADLDALVERNTERQQVAQ